MQQIFFLLTMLITASEAFLNGSNISTNNKKKISGFVPNARTLKSVDPVFGNMIKIDTEPKMISPREASTFLRLCARHKRFSNDGRTSLKELNSVGFLRNRRLRSMRRKRKPSFPIAKTVNGNSYPGRENSSVPSFSSLFDSPVNSDKFYEKASYSKSRSKISKQKQISDLHYLPFNFKQLSSNLRADMLRAKRHRRIKSGNVKKRKRNAETVNVSQANVTKHVREKDLDEESNDSLDDSYTQDSRPEFPTQHLDDTTSSWQKYFELNSQEERPYLEPPTPDDIDYYDSVLDIPPPSLYLSRMNFPIPYDRRIYEDTSFEDDDNDAKFFRKSELEDAIKCDRQKKGKKKKEKGKKSDTPRLEKLKHMLDDVECVLKEEKSKMSRKCGRGDGKQGDSGNAIRSKIEVVIPLLLQIYGELGQRPTHLQQPTEEMKSNSSEGQEERNEVKQNEKQSPDCSLDGFWLSNVMGLTMNVTTQPNLMLKICLKAVKTDAPIDESWSINGLTLAKTGGPFVLAAIYPGKKKIASFIGQCLIRENQEHVYGSWTIFAQKEKITDLLTAISTKLDVLTRKKDKDEVT